METTTPAKSFGAAGAHAVDDATALRVVLVRLQRQLRAHSGGALTPSQASVLARVEHEGPMRMGALAEAEGTSAATVSRLVDTLEAQGLVARVPDPIDGRASVVQLSAEGGNLLDELRMRSTRALRRALEQVGADERTAIAYALPALAALTDRLHCLDAGSDDGPTIGEAIEEARSRGVRPNR
ncbi:MAG: MarR family transcriptional regulator [Actinomycetota bacterium]|jgi:DNA-binding MarR family transcriptional regulator|nr:MarR family transcriptional regulator [Actinomycetota bacterium]